MIRKVGTPENTTQNNLPKSVLSTLKGVQNEPNLNISKITISACFEESYPNVDTWYRGKNEPNTNPNEANSNPTQTHCKPIFERNKSKNRKETQHTIHNLHSASRLATYLSRQTANSQYIPIKLTGLLKWAIWALSRAISMSKYLYVDEHRRRFVPIKWPNEQALIWHR